MNLSSSKKIQLIRTVYSGKGEVDTLSSGGFKGELAKSDYSKIVDLMSKIDWDTVSFPAITCCDGPVITIMISYNDTYKTFTSMTPPQSTNEFINYLTDFLTHVSLPGYNKPMDFEAPTLPPIKQ
jgi:hypothetical protein